MDARCRWFGTARAVGICALAWLGASAAAIAQIGTIETVAGGGPGTMAGTLASLRGNVKVVSDSAGNLYVSHGFGHRVYRFDAQTGTLSPIAGTGFPGYSGDGGPALQARLSNPYGVAVDEAQGRLYIADIDNSVIRAVDLATGAISTIAGNGTCGFSGDGGPATEAQVCNLLSDLALDAAGTLYFATEWGGGRIRAVQNGIIHTVAGNGVIRGGMDGQGGDPADDYLDGAPATTVSLGGVTALAVSGQGLFFYESAPFALGGVRIRRVDLSPGQHLLTTFAGNGFAYGQIDGLGNNPDDDIIDGAPALQSALAYTTAMAVDPQSGDLHAAIYTVGLIRRVSLQTDGTAGTIVTVAGGGSSPPNNVPPLNGYLGNPTGVSLDAAGTLYIAANSIIDGFGYSVYSVTAQAIGSVVGNGYAAYCGDGGPAAAACLRAPTSARPDGAGNLVIADDGNRAVRSVGLGGTMTSLIPRGDSPTGVADLLQLPAGQLLISATPAHSVYLNDPSFPDFVYFAGDSTATGSIDGEGGDDPTDDLGDGELAWVASLNSPSGLARDAQGNTFIADSGNHRVRRVDGVSGRISTVAGTGTAGSGGNGQPATQTDLSFPYGLAFDTNGDLLVSERDGHRVGRISAGADGLVTGEADESVSTIAGSGMPNFSGDGFDATYAQLQSPTGLAVDALGNVFIADTENHAIRRIDKLSGIIETIAGRGSEGDGIPAVDSRLEKPVGLSTAVVNGTSYLYVTDFAQSRVRRIDLGPASGGGNRPPVVDVGSDFSVTATSPDGGLVSLYANALDPDGDPLTYTWSGTSSTGGGAQFFQLLPIGATTLTVSVDDGQGHVVSDSVTVTVLGENTFTGGGEVVTPQDDNMPRLSGVTPGHVSVTFLGHVVTPGLTWFRTRTDQTPPPPNGKQLGSTPYYYDVGTTAVADGDVRICIDLTGMSFAFPAQVRLHRLSGAWVDLGVYPDPVSHAVCTQVAAAVAFGTYANFTPADPTTLVTATAGTGQQADGGDGGPAAAARLDTPEGLAIDATHNYLYVGEDVGNRIRRVDLTSGIITTIAGSGSFIEPPQDHVDARLSTMGSLSGLAVDRQGNLFIADQSHCLIRRVDFATNVITTVAGQWLGPGRSCGYAGDGGPATGALLQGARRMAFDSEGSLLIVQQDPALGESGAYIRRIAAGPDHLITGVADPAEIITTIAGNGLQSPPANGVHPLDAGLYPWSLAFGSEGSLYVASNDRVLRITPGADGRVDGSADESVTTVVGSLAGYERPFFGDGGHPHDAGISFPAGILVLPSGDLLVSDPLLRRIRRVSPGADGRVDGSPDESISTVGGFSDNAGQPVFNGDGYALSTTFGWPVEMARDPRGGIFVADLVLHRIRHVGLQADGGGPPAGTADLAVAAIAAPDPIDVDATLTYNVTLTNNGPVNASGVTVTLPIPANVDYVGDNAESVTCTGPPPGTAGNIVCGLGDLQAGLSNAFGIEVRPRAAGPLTTIVSVSATETDPNPANNSVSVQVTVDLEPVVIEVLETIRVADTPTVLPSVMFTVPETITVTDAPTVLPSVMFTVPETIMVTDAPTVLPSVMFTVPESIIVTDTPAVTPSVMLLVPETITVTDTPTIAAQSANVPPVAQDVSVAATVGQPVVITLLATDADSDPLTFAIVTGTAHGSLSAVGGKQVTYTPASGYVGPDSFTFKANDLQADSNNATVTITIGAAVDQTPPTALLDAPSTLAFGESLVLSGARSSDTGGGTVARYLWTIDNGPEITTDVPTFTRFVDPAHPLTLGPHTVQLRVSDDSGNTSLPAVATVTVTPLSRTLTVTKTGVGTGTVTSAPTGISCGSTCSALFDGGTVVTLTAAPNANFVFGGWTGDADCADGVVTMTANKTCTAAFNRRPDLRVSALIAPAVANANTTITVTDTTTSVAAAGGPAFPGLSTTKIYLSLDNIFDASDGLLGGRSVAQLGPGAVDSGSTTVTIPATAVGTYFLIAVADADGTVPESNENNNTRTLKIKIGANLRVSSLSAPARAGAGDTISVDDTTANAAGAADAVASKTGFYLSTDTTKDASDTFLGSRSVGALAPGATEAATTPTLTLPAGIAPGTWYVIAKADYDDALAELDETNNTRSRSIVIGPPDLLESALGAPSTVARGGSLPIADTVRNSGNGAAGPSTTRFYLSTDAAVGPGDVLLGSRRVGGLVPGQTSPGATMVVIPAGTPRGNYTLIAVADADGAVPEGDETNNARTRALRVN